MKVLVEAEDTQSVIANVAKRHFMRLRPYQIDHDINGCAAGADAPYSSYPSGHATLGWTLATVLADLAPDKAEALTARAEDYAHSRMICGSHFRSDVAASKILGQAIGRALLAAPELQAQLQSARDELAATRNRKPAP